MSVHQRRAVRLHLFIAAAAISDGAAAYRHCDGSESVGVALTAHRPCSESGASLQEKTAIVRRGQQVRTLRSHTNMFIQTQFARVEVQAIEKAQATALKMLSFLCTAIAIYR